MKFQIYSLVLAFWLGSCVKDKPEKNRMTPVQLSQAKKVYVINEGNYGSGNASVTLFDPETQQSIEDVFVTQNNSNAGDVAQSLNFLNGSFYLVMNNSKKILVCDDDFKKTGQINGFVSPRYILPLSNQKAYVSDLYANAISVVNLNSQSITSTIKCAGKSEQMQLSYNSVFVCNTEREFIYVVNAGTDQIEDSIFVGINASGMVLDKKDKLWVLTSGDQIKKAGRLTKIDALSRKVESVFEFLVSDNPWRLCLNGGKDTLYYINEDIYRFAITETNLPKTALIQKGTRNFYGLGVHPKAHTIYISDAMDYSQRSNIYVYTNKAELWHVFKAGINANGFYFE